MKLATSSPLIRSSGPSSFQRRWLGIPTRLLVLLVVLIAIGLPGCGANQDLKNLTIGVMISTTGPKTLGDEAIAAINLSIQKIQESPDFALVRDKGYQFQIWMDNVPCDPPNAFDEMMDIFTHKQHQSISAFVGPSCDDVCQPGGRLARYYDVMMISYGCESSIFDDKEEYPTFGRTTTTFKDMEVFFAEVIKHFRWPRVTLVTMATPVWQETTTEFEEEIEKLGVTVFRWTIESVASIPDPQFLQDLHSHSQTTRVYILLMYPEAVVDFMRQSEVAGLTSSEAENVFMVVDFAGSHNKMNLGPVPVSYLEGLLDITYDVQPESEGFENFLTEILQLSHLTLNSSCSNYEYGIHSMLVSDGIYVVAGAFNSSLSQNISVDEGAAIANTTRGATFQGLYHTIEMDEKATRKPRFMLHNIKGGCYTPIARTWTDGSGLAFINPNIVWPGGGNTTPRGQPKCGWDNELCPSDSKTALATGVSVGSAVLVILITIIIAIIYIWRRNLKSRLLATDWLMDWADVEPRLYYPSSNGYVGIGSTRHLGAGGSLESLSTLRSEGSDCLSAPGFGKGDGPGGTHSAAPTTTTMSAGVVFRCPVVKMDVEGIWAIKFFRKQSVSLTQSVKRELNLVRGLKHPNVNAFMGACIKTGHMSVMWAYSPKGSLLDLIHSRIFKMDLMFQLSFAQDIIKGLAYIHKSELSCHGRIKSTNVVVDAGLTCKLTDVDMPRLREGEEDLDEDDPNYWFQHVWTAPEVLRGTAEVDRQKADIYSYGILLYEIMLKRKPYVTELNTRALIEPHWESVIECVQEPEKLAEFLENSTSPDHIPEVAENEETDVEAVSSTTLGQTSPTKPAFAASRSNLPKHLQHTLYWNSFWHHLHRNRQNPVSHRTQNRTPLPPSSAAQVHPDDTGVERGKSTSVLLSAHDISNSVTPIRSLPVSPAGTEAHRNRLYGTSRRSSCDSSLSTHARTSLSPQYGSEFSKGQSLLSPQAVFSKFHQSAVSPISHKSQQNSLLAFHRPLQNMSHKKNGSPPRQKRNPRVSPSPDENNMSPLRPPALQNQIELKDISENQEPQLTSVRVDANNSSNAYSLQNTPNTNSHKSLQEQLLSPVKYNARADIPSQATPDSLHELDSRNKLTTTQNCGQSQFQRAVSPLPSVTSSLNITWAEPQVHSDLSTRTPGNTKDITSPTRRTGSLGEHKLLPISFPTSPMVIPLGSTDQSSSCPQKVNPFPPDTPPTCCCCPKLKKCPAPSLCNRKIPGDTMAHDVHAESFNSQQSMKGRHDLPENSLGVSKRVKPEFLDSIAENKQEVACSPPGNSARGLSPASAKSRLSIGQLYRNANSAPAPEKQPLLMRPEIPCWYRGSGTRAGSISVTADAAPPSSGLTNRGRAMSVDRSKLDVNRPNGEGRASALDIFSRASFNTRRAFGSHAAVTGSKPGDKEGQMLDLMKQCWAEEPELRLSADTIIKKIRGLTTGRSLSDNIEKIVSRYSEQLEVTVNERTRRLEEEKAKYFRVLCEVIPQKYVSALVSGGKVEAESFSNVTIFFSDIVGFTSICGRCSPQEVLDFLNELYTNFDIVLNSYKVYKVETIGDAYMVAGGIPEAIPDHAQQIAYLALHLLSVSTSVKAPYVTQDGIRTKRNLRLRIGLNSGPVVAGIVGEKMPRYCLYGNTVNIASRMESNGKALRVHMSKETTQELEAIGGFDISYRGMISVKGKDMPVPTYWLNNSLIHPFDLPDWTTAEEGD